MEHDELTNEVQYICSNVRALVTSEARVHVVLCTFVCIVCMCVFYVLYSVCCVLCLACVCCTVRMLL